MTTKGSALHMAAKDGIREILIMLLGKDVDVNIKDNYGKTAADICSDS